jgi:hypothetical protein
MSLVQVHYTLLINGLQFKILRLLTQTTPPRPEGGGLNQKRSYSTSSKTVTEENTTSVNKKTSSNYFSDVYEKDIGQPTTNVHLKAQRHISSGNPTDASIINEVQQTPNSIPPEALKKN